MYPKSFYDYNTFLKEKFGCKVYKISLDAGFSCPNRDGTLGTGGCIYCNNRSFSPASRAGLPSLEEQIRTGMDVGRKFKAQKFLAYFQAYTNTYSSVDYLRKVYNKVFDFPDIVGIAVGTRPDCVDEEKIGLLSDLAQKTFVSIEYGVQTANNQTLEWINRKHTYQDFLHAMEITRGKNIHITAHIMLGFPGETRNEMLFMADRMNDAGIHSIKLHNLIVTRDTTLASLYDRNPFPVFSFDEYIELVCDFLERLSPTIVIERLCATAPDEFVIAPRWDKSPAQTAEAVMRKLNERNSFQGKRWTIGRMQD